MKMIINATLLFWSASLLAGDLAIVVNKSNPLDNISKRDLRRIYLSDMTKWEDGKDILTITLPTSAPERKVFQDKVLGMSTDELAKYLNDEQIKGKNIKASSVQQTGKSAKLFVSKVPVAVAFVDIGDANGGDVKILKIDGKLPGDGGYPLK